MATVSQTASRNGNRDPTVGGVLQEDVLGATFGNQEATLDSIQRLVIGLTAQVANLAQQLKDRNQEFRDLRTLVEETNQAVSRKVHTPETQPPRADVQQTPRPTTLGAPLKVFAPRMSYRGLPEFAKPTAPVCVKSPRSSRSPSLRSCSPSP
ncbi:unnamed protein product, partial [Rhizoctonia solani]